MSWRNGIYKYLYLLRLLFRLFIHLLAHWWNWWSFGREGKALGFFWAIASIGFAEREISCTWWSLPLLPSLQLLVASWQVLGCIFQIKALMSHHLEDLMDDSDMYGWTKVQSFHAAWLNQIEQSTSSWSKLRLCRNLVWHMAMLEHTPGPSSLAGARKKPSFCIKIYNALAAPGTRACDKFNKGKCFSNDDHPYFQHICSYCLKTINRAFPDTDLTCNRRKLA